MEYLTVHLHGHSFWIVGRGGLNDGDYNEKLHSSLLNTNVTKRDTTRVEGKSWLALRYVADNPGVWLFHCHVNWHIPGGMGITLIEGADILQKEAESVKDIPCHPKSSTTNQGDRNKPMKELKLVKDEVKR